MASKKRTAAAQGVALRRSKRLKPTPSTPEANNPLTPAATAVLTTTELLEAILLHLSPSSLFPLHRVSHTFHTVITTSPRLQQRMLLRPYIPIEGWALRAIPPPMSWGVLFRRSQVEFVPACEGLRDVLQTLMPVQLWPLAAVGDRDADAAVGVALLDCVEEVEVEFMQLRKRPGTWRGMLLTDPPCHAVAFAARLVTGPPKASIPQEDDDEGAAFSDVWVYRFTKSVFDPDGVKLGETADEAEECVRGVSAQRLGKIVRAGAEVDRGLMREGDVVKKLTVRVELPDMVVPTADEWKEVHAKARKVDESEDGEEGL